MLRSVHLDKQFYSNCIHQTMSTRTTTIYSLPENVDANHLIGVLLGYSLSTKFNNPIMIIEGKSITIISDPVSHSKDELSSVSYGVPQ